MHYIFRNGKRKHGTSFHGDSLALLIFHICIKFFTFINALFMLFLTNKLNQQIWIFHFMDSDWAKSNAKLKYDIYIHSMWLPNAKRNFLLLTFFRSGIDGLFISNHAIQIYICIDSLGTSTGTIYFVKLLKFLLIFIKGTSFNEYIIHMQNGSFAKHTLS